MKKKYITLSVILLLASPVFAYSPWNVSFEAGYTLGLMNMKGLQREGRYENPGHAFEVAVPVEYRINEYVSISSGIRYIGKSYQTEKYYEGSLIRDIRSVEHFFEIPLSFRLSYGNEKVRGFVSAGAYIGVRFLSTEMGGFDMTLFMQHLGISSYWGVLDLNANVDNLFDAGILAECGVAFKVNNADEVYITARYQYSLTELDRNYQEELTHRYIDSLSITLGYTFAFGGDR